MYSNPLFTRILRQTQSSLKENLRDYLLKVYSPDEVICDNGFIYARGDYPVLLVAHMDTVHKTIPTTIYFSPSRKTLDSPQGIGGDDRCGIYMILKIIEEYKCSVLFTEDEEIGGIGAEKFSKYVLKSHSTFYEELMRNKYIMEFDRANKNDAVFYNCDNVEFEEFITKEYYKTAYGTFSDISVIAPDLGIAAVNLSCGYYKAHTKDEYIAVEELEESIENAKKILARTTDEVKQFEYIEDSLYYGSGNYDFYYRDYVIIFESEDGSEEGEIATGRSKAEAIGMFLSKHKNTCYSNILEIIASDDDEDDLAKDIK